jgi:GMP synthase-like glutamine amidotransferase
VPKLLENHRVFVIGGNYQIERIFEHEGARNVRNIQDATLLCFTGGEDVTPELYGELKHPSTHCNPRRDAWEKACFDRGVKEKKFLIGICRGGQFLNVMNGGTLWQDVDNHAISGEHPMTYQTIIDKQGKAVLSRDILVTSTHHQMMIPNIKDGAQVWGWAGLSRYKAAGIKRKDTDDWLSFKLVPNHQSDCEIVYYNNTRSLCFQPHPEYSSKSTRDIFFTCIERALAA